MSRLLEAAGLSLVPRLAPLDLACSGGEMIALVGANGSGKTSLLRALARVPGAGGTVLIDGEQLDRASEARRRSLLALLPAMREVAWPIRVCDIIALGLGGRDDGRVERMMSDFALDGLRDRTIGALSTGERSRALLARAMVAEPRLLLLDEPLSGLDAGARGAMLDALEALFAATAIPVIYVTHDAAEAARLAARTIRLDRGRVVAV